MNVSEMINSIFNDFIVIAGEGGLGREVKTVNVIDAPGIHNYMKGGEFLITTGYLLKEDPSQIRDLIIKINNNGAAALGIKLKRFIDELPKEVLETAEKLNLPIISIPIHYSFSDIINPVLSELVNKQTRSLLYSYNIHKSFTDLVIRGEGAGEIITTLGDILGVDIIYHDIIFGEIHKSRHSHDFYEETKNLSITQLIANFNSYTIKIDSKNYGYIIINSEKSRNKIDEYEQIALEHASTILKLETQRRISNQQIEERHRDEFIQDLILNNIQSHDEIKHRASLYKWNIEKGTIAVILDIDYYKEKYVKLSSPDKQRVLEESKEQIFSIAKKQIKRYFSNVFYTSFSDNIIFLVQQSSVDINNLKDEISKVSEEIRKEIFSNLHYTVMIGIGNYKEKPEEIHMSYSEARKAVLLGRTIYKEDKTVFYDQLGIFKLLETVDRDEAIYFRNAFLGKLLEYDKINDSNLLDSLIIVVENNWNLKLASEKMFIHYNTMKYRFQKISEILQVDFKKADIKLNVTIAIRLCQMID